MINNALTFMAGQREHADTADAGDIIGLHNHGTIQIGDTFSQGEALKFTGIPNFAPELFRLVRLKDPLKQKTLQKGLVQLSEEGAFLNLMNGVCMTTCSDGRLVAVLWFGLGSNLT